MLQITKVDVNLIEGEGNVVAYVNIVLDDEFKVRAIRVIRRQDGTMLMLMPSIKSRNGEYKDCCHPLTDALRTRIERVVMGRMLDLAVQGKVAKHVPSV